MLKLAFNLFLLDKLSFERLHFSFLQIVFAAVLMGLLSMFAFPYPYLNTIGLTPVIALPLAFIFNQIQIWLILLINYCFLKWWMKRGTRWSGQGNFFNLLFVIWFTVSLPYLISFILMPLSSWVLFFLPFVFYSLWFASNALHGAIPKASFWYSLGGILFSSILSFGLIYLITYFWNTPLLPYID